MLRDTVIVTMCCTTHYGNKCVGCLCVCERCGVCMCWSTSVYATYHISHKSPQTFIAAMVNIRHLYLRRITGSLYKLGIVTSSGIAKA